jgi:hypothetical protein
VVEHSAKETPVAVARGCQTAERKGRRTTPEATESTHGAGASPSAVQRSAVRTDTCWGGPWEKADCFATGITDVSVRCSRGFAYDIELAHLTSTQQQPYANAMLVWEVAVELELELELEPDSCSFVSLAATNLLAVFCGP